MAEKTREEIEKERESKRATALGNLKDQTYMNLAAAYLSDNSEGYGEAIKSAMHDYLYIPSLNSSKVNEVLVNGLLGSRQGDKRYTGNISEYKLLEYSMGIMQESLQSIKVQDILELLGSKVEVKGKYLDKYVSELAESKNEEDKKVLKAVLGTYMSNLLDTKIVKALGEKKKDSTKGLEKILTEEENK